MSFLKRLLCSHEYKFLASYSSDIDPSVGYQKEELHVIYCPRCGKKRTVLKRDYDVIMAQQKIDKYFKERDEHDK